MDVEGVGERWKKGRRKGREGQGEGKGRAGHGTARHGTARHGTARHGTARHGTAGQKGRNLTAMIGMYRLQLFFSELIGSV